MLIKKMSFSLFMSLTLIIQSGILYAATESTATTLYSMTGIIDDIRLNKNEIVISDQLFEIVPYAKIHTHKNYPNVYVIQNLTKKMIVGVKFQNNSRIITELWLLDSLPPENDSED